MHGVERVGSRGLLIRFDNIPGCFTNVYVIRTTKRNFIIDTGLGAGCAGIISEYLDPEKSAIVVNTHYHWDHVWGNGSIGNVQIIAHASFPGLLRENWDAMYGKFNRYAEEPVIEKIPDILFDSTMIFPEDDLTLFHSPGHTVDSISVFDARDKVLMAGDNIGDDMDAIVPSLFTDKATFLKTLETYKGLDFVSCVSGHNGILGREVIGMIEANL